MGQNTHTTQVTTNCEQMYQNYAQQNFKPVYLCHALESHIFLDGLRFCLALFSSHNYLHTRICSCSLGSHLKIVIASSSAIQTNEVALILYRYAHILTFLVTGTVFRVQGKAVRQRRNSWPGCWERGPDTLSPYQSAGDLYVGSL